MTARRAPVRTPGTYTLLIAELIERRQELGIRQRDLAPHLHLVQSSVANYETGLSVPSGPRLFLWADALGCDLVLVPRENS